MKKTTQLRKLIEKENIIISPGVYDCVSAKLAEKAGFKMVGITGAGMAASILGYPDVGLVSMAEVLNQTRNIVKSVDIPVFADCDTGYGNPINVYRTIQEFEDAGVAGGRAQRHLAVQGAGRGNVDGDGGGGRPGRFNRDIGATTRLNEYVIGSRCIPEMMGAGYEVQPFGDGSVAKIETVFNVMSVTADCAAGAIGE